MKVSFGVRIPVEGFLPVTTPRPDFQYFLDQAQTAEKLNYDMLLASDHVLNWIGSAPEKPATVEYLSLGTYESWTIVSALAGATKRIKFSHNVLNNFFRNPALLAKMVATLDLVSNGRFVLCLGAGWFKEESLRYGLDWFPYKQRVDRLRESIQILKSLWKNKSTNFSGRYYTLVDAFLEPKPVTKPYPPIWLGGASDGMMRMVADEADGWDVGLPFRGEGPPNAVKVKVDALVEYCDKISRNPGTIKISHSSIVVLCETEQESIQLAQAKAKDLNSPLKTFMNRHLVGTSSEIATRMNDYIAAGVQHFTLFFDRDIAVLVKFASEVMPRLD